MGSFGMLLEPPCPLEDDEGDLDTDKDGEVALCETDYAAVRAYCGGVGGEEELDSWRYDEDD